MSRRRGTESATAVAVFCFLGQARGVARVPHVGRSQMPGAGSCRRSFALRATVLALARVLLILRIAPTRAGADPPVRSPSRRSRRPFLWSEGEP